MTSTEEFVYSQPLADSMKVVLACNFPGYAYGRCYKHDIIAMPDPKGSIKAAGKIACTNPGCGATTVFIANPLAYLKERCAPNLTVKEVEAVLKEEGFSFYDFLRHDNCRPARIGRVVDIEQEEFPETKHELANERGVIHLPGHDLYIQYSGVQDGTDDEGEETWSYELRAVKPEPRTVPAVAERTVTDFVPA